MRISFINGNGTYQSSREMGPICHQGNGTYLSSREWDLSVIKGNGTYLSSREMGPISHQGKWDLSVIKGVGPICHQGKWDLSVIKGMGPISHQGKWDLSVIKGMGPITHQNKHSHHGSGAFLVYYPRLWVIRVNVTWTVHRMTKHFNCRHMISWTPWHFCEWRVVALSIMWVIKVVLQS